jgi:hypothetical protein
MIERKNWLFAGPTGAETRVTMTVIETAKLNGLDPQAYLTWLSWTASTTTRSTGWMVLPWVGAAGLVT